MAKTIVTAVELPCSVTEKISNKTNNPYYMVEIDVDNDYTLSLFLTNEQAEILRMKLGATTK